MSKSPSKHLTTPDSELREFLDSQLVVSTTSVRTDGNISYVMIRDYPTMVTKLRQLIKAEILKARIGDIKEYISDYEDMERSRAPQYLYDNLAILNNQIKEQS